MNTGWADALGTEVGNPDARQAGYTLTVYQRCPGCNGTGGTTDDPCPQCKGPNGPTGRSPETWASYTVASVESRIKGQFELAAHRNARKCIQLAEMDGDGEEAERLRKAFLADYSAGHYFWGGKAVDAVLRGGWGRQKLLHLLLVRCQPTLTEQEAEWIINEATTSAYDALRWALGNARAPAFKPGKKPLTMD